MTKEEKGKEKSHDSRPGRCALGVEGNFVSGSVG